MGDVILIRNTRHVVCDCITCGVVFTVPESMHEHQQQEGGFHHCPNGHSQGWTKEKSERERLRLERDRLKQRQAMLEDEIRAERERAEKAEAATKRLKKRTAAGVCPCCTRTFVNVQRHMQSKHPNVVALSQKTA
jgi:hypothetical protein